MDKDKVLSNLSISRSIHVPFEVTTDKNSHDVINFKEHDEESVELVLVDNSTKVFKYENITHVYSESQNPPFPRF